MTSATVRPTTSYISVENLLGGKRVLLVTPLSPLDWVSVIRRGIPASAVDSLTKFTCMSQAEMSTALGIPERTLARRKREGKLNSEESAKRSHTEARREEKAKVIDKCKTGYSRRIGLRTGEELPAPAQYLE